MEARRLEAVLELVEDPSLKDWWTSLVQARVALLDAEANRDELAAQLALMEFRAEQHQRQAIETVYRGGEQGEQAAALQAEAQRLENQGFPTLARFEEARLAASEAWYRLGAAEANLDRDRERGRPGAELDEQERARRALALGYQRLDQEKLRLWAEVERLWERSAEVSLQRAEAEVQAAKVKQEAERGFGQALDRLKRARALRAELERTQGEVARAREALEAVLAQAQRFGCALGTDFLYFRHPTQPRQAYAVAIVHDSEHYNLEVQPLAVYSVELERGVQFLLPAHARGADPEEGDRRFEAWFLSGRAGQAG